MKERISITIDERLMKDFRKYCKKHGMKVSSKVELFIKKELGKA